MQGKPEEQAALVAFLLTLTDGRVKGESAPFDHPELRVPNGAEYADPSLDAMVQVPAMGAAGGDRPGAAAAKALPGRQSAASRH